MLIREIFVFIAFAALVCASEVDDGEQKKRGAGKATSLNAIPTGVQKPDYTYSIYSQSPPQSSQSSSAYQQVPNSFYPSQGASQYYTSANPPTDASVQYPPQPHLNLLPPSSSSQFVPLNFVPNPGYQSKFQIIPSKATNGNIQLAIIPQQPIFSYPQQLFSPNSNQQVNPQQTVLNALAPQGHFNVAQNYQPLSLGSPYLGQPSTMLLLAPPNPSVYNNLLYPNPVQSFYNYYPTNSPTKYNLSYGSSPPSNEYDKGGSSIPQSISKEDNDISGHNAEYITPADTTSYKNAYTGPRSSNYAKIT